MASSPASRTYWTTADRAAFVPRASVGGFGVVNLFHFQFLRFVFGIQKTKKTERAARPLHA